MKKLTWISAVMVVALSACTAVGPTESLDGRPLRVTTTVGMIADIVKNIGGEHVDVTALMGPGVDPHLYKPSAGDISKLTRADAIFYGGLHLEGRMQDVFEKVSRLGKPTIAVTDGIDRTRLRTVDEHDGAVDPHVWFDVTLWMDAARKVNAELGRLAPEHRDIFQKNTDRYLAEMQDLHEWIQTEMKSIPPESRVLVTAHDAFGYFADQYGLEVKAVQGTSTAAEAGARDLQDLARFIAERKIKAIFVESSVPKETIESVQKAVRARGWDVVVGGELYSDAMGNEGTPEGTYIGMVRANVEHIVKALR